MRRGSSLALFSLLALVFVFAYKVNGDSPTERNALIQLYLRTNGDAWDPICKASWTGATSYCGWYGIKCNSAMQVIEIHLSNCKLDGYIPDLHPLNHLTSVRLSFNQLSGSFIDRLPNNLEILDLSENNYNGTIPREIGTFTKLTYLDLGNNFFSGEVPNEISLLSKLQLLDLSFNGLYGTFPESLMSLTNLVELDLSVNSFTGTIPESFPQQSFSLLHLSSNKFYGELPAKFFSKCEELTSLSIGDNDLVGTLPIAEVECPKLTVFDITNNTFEGYLNITEDFFAKSLITLRVSKNNFTDDIADWSRGLLQLEKLVLADFSFNNLTGEVPDSFGRLVKLDYLFLNNNTRLHSDDPYCHDNIDHCLPDFLELTWTQLAQPIGRHLYCATVIGKSRSINVRIDNSYFSFANCRCFAGFHWSHEQMRCIPCLEHGYCPGGEYQDIMVAEPGYWGSPNPEHPAAFLKCPEFAPNSSACNPNRSFNLNDTCAEGHEDRLCSRCKPGWYPWGGQCFKCAFSSLYYILPIFGFAGLALFFLYLIKMRTAPLGSVTTLFFFLQVVNILAEMGLPLPPALTSLYEGSSAVNLRFPGGPECYMGSFDFLGRFLMVLMIPIFFLVSFLVIWGGGFLWLHYKKPRQRHLKTRKRKWLVLNIRGFIFMLDFCYLVICATIFRTFLCHEDPVTGIEYMTAAPYIQCSVEDGQYWTMFVFAIVFAIVYILGIPLLFGTLLYKFRNECSQVLTENSEHESEVVLFIGWLHCDYKPEFYFWELVMLTRKAIFAMAISLTSFASYMLPVFIFIILVTSLLLHRHFRPFVTPIDNTSEEISALVLLFNFYMALIYFVPTFTVKYLYQIGYLTVVTNMAFLAYISLVMLKNMGTIEMSLWLWRKIQFHWEEYKKKRYNEQNPQQNERTSIFDAPPSNTTTTPSNPE
eukprot:TRINITY_DN4657_c0_g1_i1.p1 TRINITY_DN4657_c0_g1~~TRINITY_DN4657_c0_g1_i1.p1  ORF type:complete len:927 (-),score=127.44 TRINITY_DN4657_c0_g1_i1:29-2809(-)